MSARATIPAPAPGELAALAGLRIASRARLPANRPGARPGASLGRGTEFADVRPYSPGDDFRAIDWTLWARLGSPWTKRYQAEAELDVHLLLDVSASMGFGRPAKLELARRVAAAFALLAAARLDRFGLSTFSDRLLRVEAPSRGGDRLRAALRALEAVRAAGRTDLDAALGAYAARVPRGGVAVVLTDLDAPAGWQTGLERLLWRRLEVVLVRVLASEELEPRLEGEVELAAVEDPSGERLAAGPRAAAGYRRRLASSERAVERFCARRGIATTRLAADAPFERVVRALRAAGIWERRA